ncbi:CHASE2 domain-containing protein [Nostoc sp. LEGE 06077]|uniref:CHASE2 domain-containing protein n=1 Tax=Nostoc sp. LEGE 06077 TaxID=915325 RepID=UPI001880F37A|nr:CHASE2 domain-containing protein [Nostoc sp. LEGE 06077]MBE9209703.1 CHASE2 domain-containing protein [Nostoc sp. LEGE 06077]
MLAFSIVVTGLVMGVRWLGIPQIEQLELTAFDQLIRSRPSEAPDSRLLIIKITDQDLSKYGGYPLEDSIVAQLIGRLEQYNPRVIGLDIHRNKPRGQGRQQLISIFKKNKNFFTVCSFSNSNDNSDYAPPQELTEEQKIKQLGFSDFFPDENTNLIRRQLLSYEPSFSPSPCKTPYSFSFQLVFWFLSFEGIKPLELNQNNEWQFGKVILKSLGNRSGGYQKLGESDQILINYRSGELAPIVTLEKVLEGKIDNSLVKERVVLIGYADSSSKDWFDTPYGEKPGVYIHAYMVSQIISAVMDQRPLLAVLPQWKGIQWGDGIFVLICSFTGGLLGLLLRKLLYLLFAIFIVAFILYQICLIILIQGYWLPFLPSLLSLLITGFGTEGVTKIFEPKTRMRCE